MATETLRDHLRDSARDVRLACIAYLCSSYLEAGDVIPDVMATRPLFDDSDWISRVKPAVEKLRESGGKGPCAGTTPSSFKFWSWF